jgi:hypothetical protein
VSQIGKGIQLLVQQIHSLRLAYRLLRLEKSRKRESKIAEESLIDSGKLPWGDGRSYPMNEFLTGHIDHCQAKLE